MEDEDYRVMVLNDSTIKVFRDGRIHSLFKYKDGKEKWTDRPFRLNKGYPRVWIGSKKIEENITSITLLLFATWVKNHLVIKQTISTTLKRTTVWRTYNILLNNKIFIKE